MKHQTVKKLGVAIISAVLSMGLLLAGCGDAPANSSGNGNANSGMQPGESEDSAKNNLNALKFMMVNGAFEQKQIGNYYIIGQTFNVLNTSDEAVRLNDFVQKSTIEKLYTANPLAAFENVSIQSKTVKTQTSAGAMPCFVAYTGAEILGAGEVIQAEVCVRIPKNVVDVTFLNYGNKIGNVQRETLADAVDSKNPERAAGTTMNILQVEATAQIPTINGNQLVWPMKIVNGRTNPISVNPNNFKVTVVSGENKSKYNVQLEASLYDTNLKKDRTSEGSVTVELSGELQTGDKVVLTYVPDLQYNEYSMNWTYTK